MPIRTIVRSYDEKLVRDAVKAELARGGQVFYLHNRVETIQAVAERLAALLPKARVIVGHGQMPAGQLEEVMSAFVAGEYDILVCTTIIETGLDIPNCNTLIIEGADRFGLAQLYQLRGRVGRFNRQAYAYLFLHRHAALVGTAHRRLSAIRQYNQLGAGFRIAMRDLELRGAGNILGAAQSGHVATVGFDLYCQLLRRSVAKLRGDKGAVIAEPMVEQLIAALTANKIDVLIIDPFVSCHRVSENDNAKIDTVVKTWNRVAERANCAIELVHHVRKAPGDVTIEDARGAAALKDGLRMSRVLNVMGEEDAARFNIGVAERRAFVRVDSGKVNLTPAGAGPLWRRLVSVSLGNATKDRPADSVGVITAWEPDALPAIPAPDVLAIQTVVSNDEWRVDIRSPNWVGRAVAEAMNLRLEQPEQRNRAQITVKEMVAKGWLRVVQKRDAKRRVMTFVEVGEWVE